jgi:hypothetical protein
VLAQESKQPPLLHPLYNMLNRGHTQRPSGLKRGSHSSVHVEALAPAHLQLQLQCGKATLQLKWVRGGQRKGRNKHALSNAQKSYHRRH